MPNEAIDKTLNGKLSKEKLIRFIEALRNDSFQIETSASSMIEYVKQMISDEELSTQIIKEIREHKFKNLFHVKDEATLRQKQKIAEEHRKKNKKDKKG
jgi:hypothetical protein